MTLEEAFIARFNEIGFSKQIMDEEVAVFGACYRATVQRGWVFIYDTRVNPPTYVAFPPETPASCLYRLPKV